MRRNTLEILEQIVGFLQILILRLVRLYIWDLKFLISLKLKSLICSTISQQIWDKYLRDSGTDSGFPTDPNSEIDPSLYLGFKSVKKNICNLISFSSRLETKYLGETSADIGFPNSETGPENGFFSSWTQVMCFSRSSMFGKLILHLAHLNIYLFLSVPSLFLDLKALIRGCLKNK